MWPRDQAWEDAGSGVADSVPHRAPLNERATPRWGSPHSPSGQRGRPAAVNGLELQEQELQEQEKGRAMQLRGRQLMPVDLGSASGVVSATPAAERVKLHRAVVLKRRQLVLLKSLNLVPKSARPNEASLSHARTNRKAVGGDALAHTQLKAAKAGPSREAQPPSILLAPLVLKDAAPGAGPKRTGSPRSSCTWREPTTHACTLHTSLRRPGNGPPSSPIVSQKTALACPKISDGHKRYPTFFERLTSGSSVSGNSGRPGIQTFRKRNPPPSPTEPASLGFRRARLSLPILPLPPPKASAQAPLAGGWRLGGLALARCSAPRFPRERAGRGGRGTGSGAKVRDLVGRRGPWSPLAVAGD